MTRPVLCANCHRLIEAEQAVRGGRIMLSIRGVLEPHQPSEILCGIAMQKGILYTLNDGREVFEYHVLKDIANRFPQFLQVNRNALVRRDAITAIIYEGEQRLVEVGGCKRILVSRRLWMQAKMTALADPEMKIQRVR